MAGYTRQSIASIINGEDITAPPLTAEFNQLADAFNGSTGHSHDGTTGNAPKIDLTTSVTGFLPAVHGGIGGKNNFAATTNPLATDDAVAGYAPGSMWENTTTGRIFICVGNTSSAAVWRELVQVVTSNKIEPIAHDTIDLGTPSVRFQDLYLSGGISASGNAAIGGTLAVSGATTLNSTLQVVGTTLLNGNVTLGDADTDNITFSGEVISAITPSTTNAYDLGTATKEWRDLYLDGTAHVDTLDVDENAGIIGNLEVTGNTTLTGTLGVTGDATVANLSATGTTTITSVDLNSGAIDGAVIGSALPAAGTFTTLNANTSLTAATADINGGTLDGVTIGGTTSAPATVTSLTATGTSTLTTVDINGGAIDGTTIGATSHTTGKFTTLQSTGAATLATVNIDGGTIDGTAIGGFATSSGAFTTVSASGGFTGDVTGDVTGNLTGNVTGNVTGNITGNVTGNVSASTGTSTFNNVTINGGLDMNAGTTATITNLTSPTNTNDAATKGYVDTSLANLVDSAPGTLDTLNELAAALGDDPNFSTTITNSIATKLPLAGGTMTGAIAMGTSKITGMGDPTAAQDAATKNYVDTQDALQVSKSGDSMSGNLAMGSNNITGLATPTANDHAANKSYVDGVLGSATAASASAAAAATSETNAATSETNAANSATAAASSATSAAASYDDFDDRYLGAKATAPTVDNDGDALIVGALYFDTTTDTMKVYGSSGWVNAGSSVNGTSDRQTYTAYSGQTVFAATYDAGYVDVYLNGVKLLAGTDFTATNGTSIVLASGAAVNDIVDIVAYGTFVLADHLTETQSDAKYVQQTHTGNVDITGNLSTDGLTVETGVTTQATAIELNGTSFADTERLSLDFSRGGNQGVRLSLEPDEAQTNGDFVIETGSFGSTSDRLRIEANGDISFYDGSGNAKFFWDASAERLGIGTSSPDTSLHISGSTPDITFQDTDLGDKYVLGNNNGSFRLRNVTDARTDITVSGSGNVGIGGTPSTNFEVFGPVQNRARLQTTSTELNLQFWNDSGPTFAASIGTGNPVSNLSGTDGLKFDIFNGTYWSEAARFDTSNNFLVGKTSPNGNTVGGEIRATGQIFATASSTTPMYVRRKGDNTGELLGFETSNGAVGSITTHDTRLAIGSDDTYIMFDSGSSPAIWPSSGTAGYDNAIDIGDASRRFKDLYLSGGVVFGSTGGNVTSKTLDDYEEGTWTPTVLYGGSDTGQSYSIRTSRYTKIGRVVYYSAYIQVATNSSATGVLSVGGLPYASATGSNLFWTGTAGFDNASSNVDQPVGRVANGTTEVQLFTGNNTNNWAIHTDSIRGSAFRVLIAGHYETN